jgi:multimeric flavodoxin WrbA
MIFRRSIKRSTDALIFVTPVYWGQPSESAKSFLDRYRRSEATKGDQSGLAGKFVLCVAAPGGSGNGAMTTLSELERWCQHVRAERWDLIGVTKRSRAYKLETICQAARALATG